MLAIAAAAGCGSFSSDDPSDPDGTGGGEGATQDGPGSPDVTGDATADAGRALTAAFARSFGSVDDAGDAGATMIAPSMVVDPGGGIALLGSYAGGAVDLGGGRTLPIVPSSDLYLARFDASGLATTSATFGDDKQQFASGLTGTGDRLYASVIVDGTTAFNTGIFIASDGLAGKFNSAVARFDGALKGNALATFKSAQNAFVTNVATGASGSVIAFGTWESAVSVNGGSSNTRTALGPGLFFGRFFALSGADIVHTDYCPDGTTACTASALGTNPATGEVLAGGRFTGSLGDGDGGTVTAAEDEDAFLMSLDAQLQRRWVISIGGSSTQAVQAIAPVPQTNDFVVAGVFDGTLAVRGAPTVLSKGLTDVFVLRVDPKGTIVWSKTLGGAGADRVRAIAADASGDVFLAGHFTGPTLETGGAVLANADVAGRGTADAFVAWLDPSGAPLYAARFGDGGNDIASALGLTASGDVVVAGSFDGTIDFGTGPLHARGRTDTFLVKLTR